MAKEFDPTKPCATVDGRKAKVMAVDVDGGNDGPLIAARIANRVAALGEYIALFYPNGSAFGFDAQEGLVNVPEKIVRYVNWYETGNSAFVTSYASRRDAENAAAGWHRIACIRVEFEEGQFDE